MSLSWEDIESNVVTITDSPSSIFVPISSNFPVVVLFFDALGASNGAIFLPLFFGSSSTLRHRRDRQDTHLRFLRVPVFAVILVVVIIVVLVIVLVVIFVATIRCDSW